MKFYYFQDNINGYDSHLFSTKRAALDWIRHADKTYLEEGNDTFEEHDMQILYVSTHNKKSMLRAMGNASMIVGTRLFTPEVDHD